MAEIMKPTSLVSGFETFSRFGLAFSFTRKQRRKIVKSREFKSGEHSDYNVQVHLRFCLVDTGCEQGDLFPPGLSIHVNGERSGWINPDSTSKAGLPVDITAQCRLTNKLSETVTVLWSSETGQEYCVAVYLVRKLSTERLLQQLKQDGSLHADETVVLIKKKLAHESDGEIATSSFRVSLICPISKVRMQTPCRSRACSHLQCFDAGSYLLLNEKNPRWVCPLCNKPAPFDKLLIDGFFLKVFQNAPGCSDIELHEDGSWVPIEHNTDIHQLPGPAITSNSTLHTGRSTKRLEVIDLTLGSPDDKNVDTRTKSKKRAREDTGVCQPSKKQRVSLHSHKENLPTGASQSKHQSNKKQRASLQAHKEDLPTGTHQSNKKQRVSLQAHKEDLPTGTSQSKHQSNKKQKVSLQAHKEDLPTGTSQSKHQSNKKQKVSLQAHKEDLLGGTIQSGSQSKQQSNSLSNQQSNSTARKRRNKAYKKRAQKDNCW